MGLEKKYIIIMDYPNRLLALADLHRTEISKLKEKVKEFKKKARISNNDFKREKDKADYLEKIVLSWRRNCERKYEENEILKKENEILKEEIKNANYHNNSRVILT